MATAPAGGGLRLAGKFTQQFMLIPMLGTENMQIRAMQLSLELLPGMPAPRPPEGFVAIEGGGMAALEVD